ncbi:MAG TPA: GGDEF domain-containing protein, partial [Candidatus Dormibacteraeota bacterium]
MDTPAGAANATKEWLKTQHAIAVGRWIAVAVGFGLAFAIQANLKENQPAPISRPGLVAMTIVLAAYNAVAFFGLERICGRSKVLAERVVGAFIVGDFLICAGWVLLLSNNHFNTGFALFCVIAIEVAVNYPQSWRIAALFLTGYAGTLIASRLIGQFHGEPIIFHIHWDEIGFRLFVVVTVSFLTTAITREREKLRQLAEARSVTDALTGLGNRRALDTRLAEEVVRAERIGYPLTVLLADVDNFKTYNDTYGHRFGDEILRVIGRVLQTQGLRQGSDHAYRYGGEEFLVLLPGTGGSDALEVAERLREAIRSETATIRLPQGPVPVTVSVGLAVYPTDAATADEVVQRADSALYKAKEKRDRAV